MAICGRGASVEPRLTRTTSLLLEARIASGIAPDEEDDFDWRGGPGGLGGGGGTLVKPWNSASW